MRSRLRLVSLSLVTFCAAFSPEGVFAQVDPGQRLFMIHCSACHGKDGDGNGTQPLDPKARNFREGKFQFGNSRTAFFRTVSAGLPGRAVMPGFATVLSEEERWQVVDFVQTLLPGGPERENAASMLEVFGAPRIVRGLLGPIVDGAPQSPRGLLLGYPDGKTFEYRTDDVRLLGVRQGGFVDRRDWYGRGGSALRPLGKVVFPMANGQPSTTFQLVDANAGMQPLLARLVATDVSGTRVPGSRSLEIDVSAWKANVAAHARGGLEYELVTRAGDVVADVYEEPQGFESSLGWGFTRTFGLTGRGEVKLRLALLETSDDLVVEQTVPMDVDGPTWYVVRRSEQLAWLLRVEGPGTVVISPRGVSLDGELSTEPEVVRFDLLTTISWKGDASIFATLEREIARHR